jgi:hypothetical protein
MGKDRARDGYVAVPYVILYDDLLPAAYKWVWIIIYSHFNWQTHQCNPSLETIMRESGKSRSVVLKARKMLNRLGHLSWISETNGRKDGRSCRYSFYQKSFPKEFLARMRVVQK